MALVKTKLKGVYIVEPTVHGDSRGWFMETYSTRDFEKAGLYYDFKQDNQSYSSEKGILRGLHFQNNPMAQTKLVRCTRGAILDVAVDIRRGSENYLQYVAVELSEENKKQLLIPQGFAHGFVTLTDDVEVQYKVDNLYSKECDRGIRYNDPSIAVDWGSMVDYTKLSPKDQTSPMLKDSDCNFTIKVLVTGVKGQLGYDAIRKLQAMGYSCVGIDIEDCDLTDSHAVDKYFRSCRPDVIVHCAAYTAVDKAETDAETCAKVNVLATENVARIAAELEAKMVYISTDYVYSGEGDKPFMTTDPVSPNNVYGKTKLEGENVAKLLVDKLFIVRTSWVFGKNGNNFVKTMLRLSDAKQSLNVVNDQIGSPTYTVDLADFIFFLINTDKYGVYHCSNENFCSWADFAKEIFKLSDKTTIVHPVATSEYPASVAKRPLNSRLDKSALEQIGYGKMPTWQDALQRYLKEIL